VLNTPCKRIKIYSSSVFRLLFGAIVSLIVGCSAPQPMSIDPSVLTPENWSANEVLSENLADESVSVTSDVFSRHKTEEQLANYFGLHTPELLTLVQEGLAHNPALAAAQEKVMQSELALRATRADRFPLISLATDMTRPESNESTFSINANVSWSIDLWGELSAAQRQAQLEYASAIANFKQERMTLIANTYRQWFQLQESQLLVTLYQERTQSVQGDLEVMESGYLNGLYEALDLYLARNDANAQIAKLSEQEQTLKETQRGLEQLLGRYPKAMIGADEALPLTPMLSQVPLPSSIIQQRPDLQASWLSLLAADQALAVAHRARFPHLSLTGRYGGSSDVLSDLVNRSNLAWSLGASLAATLFDAGQLEANQSLKASQRRGLEQSYLNDLYTAFAEVENSLSAESSLRQQYALYREAQANAVHAESLSFERYQRGLEDYNTVLEAQRRSLDAQTTIIGLRRSLLQNRVDLMVALGGALDPQFAVNDPPENTLLEEKLQP